VGRPLGARRRGLEAFALPTFFDEGPPPIPRMAENPKEKGAIEPHGAEMLSFGTPPQRPPDPANDPRQTASLFKSPGSRIINMVGKTRPGLRENSQRSASQANPAIKKPARIPSITVAGNFQWHGKGLIPRNPATPPPQRTPGPRRPTFHVARCPGIRPRPSRISHPNGSTSSSSTGSHHIRIMAVGNGHKGPASSAFDPRDHNGRG